MAQPVVRSIFLITLCQSLFGGIFSALYLVFAVCERCICRRSCWV